MTHPFRNPTDAAHWLQTQLTHLATNPDAEHIYNELTTATSRAHRTIDRPPDRQYLGACPTCNRDLHAQHDDTHVTCRCGWIGEVATLIDQALEQHRDALFTDSELVGVFAIDDREVTRNQINSWARSGRLIAHDQPRWNKHAQKVETRRTYRFSEVDALVRELAEKRRRTA